MKGRKSNKESIICTKKQKKKWNQTLETEYNKIHEEAITIFKQIEFGDHQIDHLVTNDDFFQSGGTL